MDLSMWIKMMMDKGPMNAHRKNHLIGIKKLLHLMVQRWNKTKEAGAFPASLVNIGE